MRILITAARSSVSLDLARQFGAAGHTVYAADTTQLNLCIASNSVTKCFRIPSPRYETERFISELVRLVEELSIDLLVPTFEETIYLSDALDHFPSSCHVFCTPFETTHALHNKWHFANRIASYGFASPRTRLVHSQHDLNTVDFKETFILKGCYSRAAQSLHVIDPAKPLPTIKYEPNNPWIAQEYISGLKLCTYSICRDGRVQAHATYPVVIGIGGISCVSYESLHHKGTFEWVERWARLEGYTGQVGFDFIEDASGTLYAIECNPRGTAGVHLFDKRDQLARAFTEELPAPILPAEGRRRQLAFGMLLYGWRPSSSERPLGEIVKRFFTTPDVVLRFSDFKPFAMQFFLSYLYWRQKSRLSLPLPAAFNADLEWNGPQTEETSSATHQVGT
jgi:ATP-grasp domain